jgi:hypothetical protein
MCDFVKMIIEHTSMDDGFFFDGVFKHVRGWGWWDIGGNNDTA